MSYGLALFGSVCVCVCVCVCCCVTCLCHRLIFLVCSSGLVKRRVYSIFFCNDLSCMSCLEAEACQYLFYLWGKGYSRSYLKGAVSALRALEDMEWVPPFVTKRVCRCAKWSLSPAVCCPYAELDELRLFARTCGSRAQRTACALAFLSFACLLRVGEASPLRQGGLPCEGAAVLHRQVRRAPRPAEFGVVRHGVAAVAGRVGEYGTRVHGPLLPPRIGIPAAHHGLGARQKRRQQSPYKHATHT